MAEQATPWLSVHYLHGSITREDLVTRFSRFTGLQDTTIIEAPPHRHGMISFENHAFATQALLAHGQSFSTGEHISVVTHFYPERLTAQERVRYMGVIAETSADHPSPPRKKAKLTPTLPECPICGDEVKKDDQCRPCRQCRTIWCTECLQMFFMTATQDHERMPARCCLKVMHHGVAGGILSTAELEVYKLKYDEHSTTSPLYCPVKTCSTFIPPRLFDKDSNQTKCRICETLVCTQCKEIAEDRHSCDAGKKTDEKEDISRLRYKVCPKCNIGVQKMYGCPHVRCQCGAHWCWDCQRPINVCYRKPCVVAREAGEYSEPGSDDDDEDEEHAEARPAPLHVNPVGSRADLRIDPTSASGLDIRRLVSEAAQLPEAETFTSRADGMSQALIDQPGEIMPAGWPSSRDPQTTATTSTSVRPPVPTAQSISRPFLSQRMIGTIVFRDLYTPQATSSGSSRMDDARLLASMARGRQRVTLDVSRPDHQIVPATSTLTMPAYGIPFPYPNYPNLINDLRTPAAQLQPSQSGPYTDESDLISDSLSVQFNSSRRALSSGIDSAVSQDSQRLSESGTSVTNRSSRSRESNESDAGTQSSTGQAQISRQLEADRGPTILPDPIPASHDLTLSSLPSTSGSSAREAMYRAVARDRLLGSNIRAHPSRIYNPDLLNSHVSGPSAWLGTSRSSTNHVPLPPPPVPMPMPMPMSVPVLVPMQETGPEIGSETGTGTLVEHPPERQSTARLRRPAAVEANLDDPYLRNWEAEDLNFGDEPQDEPFDVWGCRHKFAVLRKDSIVEGWMKDEKYLECMRCFEHVIAFEPKVSVKQESQGSDEKSRGTGDEDKFAYECKKCGVFWCKTCRVEAKATLRGQMNIKSERRA